jgi:ATP-binding cassette subfamily B protein
MENIRYGKIDATDDEVIESAKKAHAHEFISIMPAGYATLVGEGA